MGSQSWFHISVLKLLKYWLICSFTSHQTQIISLKLSTRCEEWRLVWPLASSQCFQEKGPFHGCALYHRGAVCGCRGGQKSVQCGGRCLKSMASFSDIIMVGGVFFLLPQANIYILNLQYPSIKSSHSVAFKCPPKTAKRTNCIMQKRFTDRLCGGENCWVSSFVSCVR